MLARSFTFKTSYNTQGVKKNWYHKYVPIARTHVARFTRAIPQSPSLAFHVSYAKIRLSKSHHETKLWASQNIFAGHDLFGFSKYGHTLGKTLW
jgi:hypothetical protein